MIKITRWRSASLLLPSMARPRSSPMWEDFDLIRPLGPSSAIRLGTSQRPLDPEGISVLSEWSGQGTWLPSRPLPTGFAVSLPLDASLPATPSWLTALRGLPTSATRNDAVQLLTWWRIVAPHHNRPVEPGRLLRSFRSAQSGRWNDLEVAGYLDLAAASDWPSIQHPWLEVIRGLPVNARAAVFGPIPGVISEATWSAARHRAWVGYGVLLCPWGMGQGSLPVVDADGTQVPTRATRAVERVRQRVSAGISRSLRESTRPPNQVRSAPDRAPGTAEVGTPTLPTRPTARGTWPIRTLICDQPAHTWSRVGRLQPSDFKVDGSTGTLRVLVPDLSQILPNEPCRHWLVCPHQRAHEAVMQLWQTGSNPLFLPSVDVLSTLVDHQREAPT